MVGIVSKDTQRFNRSGRANVLIFTAHRVTIYLVYVYVKYVYVYSHPQNSDKTLALFSIDLLQFVRFS